MTLRSAGDASPHVPSASAEAITAGGVTLALVVRAVPAPPGAQFVTPPEAGLQVGVLTHAEGTNISRHKHRQIERQVSGTSEVLLVRSGSCEVDVYDDDELTATTQLSPGDVMVLLAGGHALRMLEDTVLVEVKQGPYVGVEEKVRY
jgi:mannose-6-phosphate isomerase-like protein (cupin superfamily)